MVDLIKISPRFVRCCKEFMNMEIEEEKPATPPAPAPPAGVFPGTTNPWGF